MTLIKTFLFLFKGTVYLMLPVSRSLFSGLLSLTAQSTPTPKCRTYPAENGQGMLWQCAKLAKSRTDGGGPAKILLCSCLLHFLIHTNLHRYEPLSSSFPSLQKRPDLKQVYEQPDEMVGQKVMVATECLVGKPISRMGVHYYLFFTCRFLLVEYL